MKINYRYRRLPDSFDLVERAKDKKGLPARDVDRLSYKWDRVFPYGGVTEAWTEIAPGVTLTAKVICSFKDRFVKKIGRDLATKRLIEAIEKMHNHFFGAGKVERMQLILDPTFCQKCGWHHPLEISCPIIKTETVCNSE